MKKVITTEDILNDRTLFTQEQADRIEANALKEAEKYWGGKRAGSGKKAQISGSPRNTNVKVSPDVKEAIQYAYKVGIVINLDDIKLLQYVKEHGLTLSSLQKA